MSELFLIVRLAGERVALRAAEVEAVVEIESVSRVPGAPPHVCGLSALRSRVVTVIDAATSVGVRQDTQSPRQDAAVAVVDGHPYALLVDSVEDVAAASGEPQSLPGSLGAGWSRVAAASVEVGGDLLLLVEIPALIAGPIAEAA
jgi:purine-binding chemotaxis protein CheW